MAKLSKGLDSELQYEKENYQKPEQMTKLQGWKATDAPGDVNLALEKTVGEKVVKVEWQLTPPFDENLDGFDAPEGEEEAPTPPQSTDFTITVESKNEGDGSGMTFFCSTQQGEGHRYIIGNVKCYSSQAEKDSVSSFNGPEFDDLDEKLQESMDEYLGELGVGDDVFDYIDASSVDKEHREYMRWLETVHGFMKA